MRRLGLGRLEEVLTNQIGPSQVAKRLLTQPSELLGSTDSLVIRHCQISTRVCGNGDSRSFRCDTPDPGIPASRPLSALPLILSCTLILS